MDYFSTTSDQAAAAASAPAQLQPRGLRYLTRTWSGRILLVNTAVFLFLCWRTHSLFSPDTDTLLAFGAKDSVKLVQGEFWRFLTPIFLHIGLLHFGFNSYFLYVVGYQLERLLGGAWFVGIYLLAGIFGNIASAAFSVSLSAGASSSLFGLLGAGLFLERSVGSHIKAVTGRRPRQRAYAMTVLINLGFGLLMPFIDNAAHVGGLIAGLLLTGAMVRLRPNNLHSRQPLVAGLLICALAGAALGLAYYSMTPRYVVARLEKAAAATADLEERVHDLSLALAIDAGADAARLQRARALFAAGENNYAFHDVRTLLATGDSEDDLNALADELEQAGKGSEAWELRRMLTYSGESL